jgi:hypothetical protein
MILKYKYLRKINRRCSRNNNRKKRRRSYSRNNSRMKIMMLNMITLLISLKRCYVKKRIKKVLIHQRVEELMLLNI